MVRKVLSVWLKEDGEQWEYLVRMFKAEGAASIKALKKSRSEPRMCTGCRKEAEGPECRAGGVVWWTI